MLSALTLEQETREKERSYIYREWKGYEIPILNGRCSDFAVNHELSVR